MGRWFNPALSGVFHRLPLFIRFLRRLAVGTRKGRPQRAVGETPLGPQRSSLLGDRLLAPSVCTPLC